MGKGDYIPGALFYLLGMKANNTSAHEFQRWMAVDVLVQIRKNGSYRNASSVVDIGGQDPSLEFKAISCIDKFTIEIKNRIDKIEDNRTIDYSQQEELRAFTSKMCLKTYCIVNILIIILILRMVKKQKYL